MTQEIIKTPNETYPLSIDYTDRLPSGASLVSATAVIYDNDEDSATTSTMIPGSVTASSPNLTFDLLAGTAGKDYLLIVTAIITGSKPLVDFFRVRVVQPK